MVNGMLEHQYADDSDFGIVINVSPPDSSDHDLLYSSSGVVAKHFLAASALTSNRLRISSQLPRFGEAYGSPAAGLMSQESRVRVPATQPGISPRWFATQPIVFDFS